MAAVLKNKFRGALIGGLMGDCFGAPFEGESSISLSQLNRYFNGLQDPMKRLPYKPYTDDTAMAKCVAQSIIDSKGYEAVDMAKRFVQEYYQEPYRGYGANVSEVFAKLRGNKFSDVYNPAALQFNGTGSYGNGGAMRVAPVALFCYANENNLVDVAKDQALLTHGNRLGYNGAILQCLAVHSALHTEVGHINPEKYIESLITRMKEVETPKQDEILDGVDPFTYVDKLKRVVKLLAKNSVTTDEIEFQLGNNIAAHLSVPTAIYCFIQSLQHIADVECENPLQRTIQYAISLGGDTDTIACMAGNIAGAYYGESSVPEGLKRHCESYTNILQQADDLYSLVNNS